MTIEVWLAFVAATAILLIIPGPTVLLVIGDALANRQKHSWATALGVAAGDGIAMTTSLAGAGALLRASATAFAVMKTIGGIYLLYLGASSILRARKQTSATVASDTPVRPQKSLRRFTKAFVVTVLNPKGILFFIAFVPQFISPHESFVAQASLLLLTFVFLAWVNASMYGVAARWLGSRLVSASAQRKVGYAGGIALIGAGTLTLALEHR